jgi:hypothetical protein
VGVGLPVGVTGVDVLSIPRQELSTKAPAASVPSPVRNFRRDKKKGSGVISDEGIFFIPLSPFTKVSFPYYFLSLKENMINITLLADRGIAGSERWKIMTILDCDSRRLTLFCASIYLI